MSPKRVPICLVLLAGWGIAQDFECQGSPCFYFPPVPLGAGGDCEGVSWNGLGLVTVDTANGCGFPTSGQAYLRIAAHGPEATQPGIPPAALSGAAAVAWIPVPAGATAVSFDWDFYNAEGASAPFNDGMLLDVLDAAGTRLLLLAFADTTSPLGTCTDGGGCGSGALGIDLAAPGPEAVTAAALPAGAARLRVAVWNGTDNLFPSHGVLDDVVFALPPATYPGTGEDLVLLSAVVPGPAPFPPPAPTAFPDVKTLGVGGLALFRFVSPLGSLNGHLLIVGFNLLPTGAFPPPDPLLSLFGIHLRPGFNFVTVFGLIPPVMPGGTDLSLVAPPGLSGFSLLVQGAVVLPAAANGVLVAADAHELRFL
jgi:hypothetical protein